MQQLKEGEENHGADVTLYDRYASLIFAYVNRQLPNQQDAEDVLLEVFMAALLHDHLLEFTAEQQIAWLHRVARNKVIDRYRHNTQVTILPLELALEMVDADPTPEQHIEQQEAYERLYHSLEQLPLLQQQVVRLRFGNGLRFSEIADLLGKSEGTVRRLLFRTLRRLRSIYEQK